MNNSNLCIEPQNTSGGDWLLDAVWFVKNGYSARVFSAINCVVGVLSIVLNGLVIGYVRYRTQKVRQVKYKHFFQYSKASLAVCDGLAGFFCILTGVLAFYDDCELPSFSKKIDEINASVSGPFLIVSFYNLTFIAIQRYQAIVSPLSHASKLSQGRAKLKYFTSLSAVWLIPIVTGFLSQWVFSLYELNQDINYYYVFFMMHIASIYVPYFTTVLSTFAMFYMYRKQARALLQYDPIHLKKARQVNSIRITKIVCQISIGYTVTCTPYMVFYLQRAIERIKNNYRDEEFLDYSVARNIQGALMMANTVVDFFVYASKDPLFNIFVRNVYLALTCRSSQMKPLNHQDDGSSTPVEGPETASSVKRHSSET